MERSYLALRDVDWSTQLIVGGRVMVVWWLWAVTVHGLGLMLASARLPGDPWKGA